MSSGAGAELLPRGELTWRVELREATGVVSVDGVGRTLAEALAFLEERLELAAGAAAADLNAADQALALVRASKGS